MSKRRKPPNNMVEVLLTSEKLVKEIACINDNIAGDYIRAAVIEAQNIRLKSIIGPALLSKLKSMISDGSIEASGNELYKDVVDQVQYYLAYQTLAELTYKTTYKLSNFGVVKTDDENVSVPSFDDVEKVRASYQNKADYYCIELQTFLLKNRSKLPELDANRCDRIHANLKSAATCGLFLGGVRGK